MSSLAHDIASLVELQAKLFRLDVQEAGSKMILPAILVVLAAVLALGAVPVALIGFANFLRDAGVSYAASLLIVAACGLVVAGVLGAVAWFRVRKGLAVIGRSQDELNHNIRWIKHVLTRSTQEPEDAD